ncbi:ATPase with chaperone activity [Rhodoferax sp. GW822-FHT02A01]|uniref:ATPase with chaperone activity n=1 Tax=Rhodoferax sp. GW822-FHT02A01 TaxID=3141537 RepID=UPI00315C8E56
MSEDNQIEIPQSFIALFIEPGRSKPAATRFFIAERYELCEDMANMLTQTAQEMLHGLGITEADVLQRCYLGLVAGDAVFSVAEAEWVVRRLAELSQWPQPLQLSAP